LANAIEQRGFFWWFNEPTRTANSKQSSVPGLLTVTQTGQVTLNLDGAIAENGEHADWSKPYSFGRSRIVGLLDTPGAYVLLEEVERTDFSIAGDDTPKRQSLSATICTRREFPFPDDFQQRGFIELRIDLKGLEEWLNLESIVVENDYGYEDGERKTVTYTDHHINFPVPGGTLAIESLTTGGNSLLGFGRAVREVKFEQLFYICYRPDEPSDMSQLQYVFAKIEEFMALILGSYFRFERPTFVRKEQPFDSWMTIYSHGPAPTAEPPNRFQMWLQFTDIRDHFGRLFAEWLAGSELYGPGFYLYIAALRNPHVYTEDRLFTLATGIEALHRRCFDSENSSSALHEKSRVSEILNLFSETDPNRKWLVKKLAHAHEPSLEARLLESLRQLPFRFGKGQLEKFAKNCAAQRNDISHRGGPNRDIDYNAFHQEAFRLAEALACFFHVLLLNKIGMPRDLLTKLMTESIVAERFIKPTLSEVGLEILI
jgi:ApeA N-terminal domain 1